MLFGAYDGSLELRGVGAQVTLHGEFPYNKVAVLSDGGRNGGRPRKEKIAGNAFAYRVNDPNEDIHLLAGHDYNKPLASKGTGTLDIVSDERALSFLARIAPEIFQSPYGQEVLAQLKSGLAKGISPGFRLPPTRAVAQAEKITQEPYQPEIGNHGATIREVIQGLLYELSVVTVPAYPEAQVEMRSWELTEHLFLPRKRRILL
jgi:HK97 family phage prohead protease